MQPIGLMAGAGRVSMTDLYGSARLAGAHGVAYGTVGDASGKAVTTSLSSTTSSTGSVILDISSAGTADTAASARVTQGDADSEDDEKKFKSIKELVGYLTLLMMRWMQEKPAPGEGQVKMEDRADFEKLREELQSVVSDNTVVL